MEGLSSPAETINRPLRHLSATNFTADHAASQIVNRAQALSRRRTDLLTRPMRHQDWRLPISLHCDIVELPAPEQFWLTMQRYADRAMRRNGYLTEVVNGCCVPAWLYHRLFTSPQF